MTEPAPGIVIKFNNTGADTPCAICGERVNPDVGAALFLEGTWDAVCYDCGQSRAPWMVKWVELINRTKTDTVGTYDPNWDVQDIGAVNEEHRRGWEAMNATEHYFVRVYDSATETETVSGPTFSEQAATTHAEELAERLADQLAQTHGLGADDTRFEVDGRGRYIVWRAIDADQEDAAYVITVEEEEVDQEPVINEDHT